MSFVKHGRRQGSSRENSARGKLGKPADVIGMREENGLLPSLTVKKLNDVAILSKADWERIQLQLHARQLEEERLKRQLDEKDRLHELSKNQIKHWTNTIEGQRQQRLEAHKIHQAKIDEERKQTDLEEAKYLAQKRKEAIEKAKTQQYYQTDRVKGFNSALLLTEVLKERDAQLELHKLKASTAIVREKEYVAHERLEYEATMLSEENQTKKRLDKNKLISEFQKAQINDHLRARDQEQKEDHLEGQELKRLAVEHDQESRRLQEIRRQESSILLQNNVAQLSDIKRLNEIRLQQQEEEDEECRIFAAAKRKMMKLRSEKERALYNEKQQLLQLSQKKLSSQMQQRMDDEDERIARALEEAEEKTNKAEREKLEGFMKMQQSIEKHRMEQLRDHDTKKAEEKNFELEKMLEIRAADAEFKANEAAKKNRRFENAKILQTFHNKQIKQHEDDAEGVRQQDLGQHEKNLELLALEERQFQEYATKVMNHCEKGGRSMYALRKAAQPGAGGGHGPVFEGKGGIRPSYPEQTGVQLPKYQRATTEATKELISGKNQTHKRLGFVW